MHEMSIASSILEAVKKEARRYPGSRATKVAVRIGELTAIDGESLRFCFEVLAGEMELNDLELEIEWCPRRHRCASCNQAFVVRDYDFRCPACHELAPECISGDELELAYVEVEQDEPSAVGKESS